MNLALARQQVPETSAAEDQQGRTRDRQHIQSLTSVGRLSIYASGLPVGRVMAAALSEILARLARDVSGALIVRDRAGVLHLILELMHRRDLDALGVADRHEV